MRCKDDHVIPRRFERLTCCLEGSCSIQLSYEILCFTLNFKVVKKTCKLIGLQVLSGWQDSNLRPPGPKPGAITGLRYTPKAEGRQI